MKWLSAAVLIALFAAASIFTYARYKKLELQEYCAQLQKFVELPKIREQAKSLGFNVEQEAFVQMRITPMKWLPSPPTCRVFFNPERMLEYRVWQD
jgi:hypothetical protein